MYFLRAKAANRIPPMVVPSRMHHVGDYIISISRLTAFLAEQAEAAGVEVYHGYTARTLIIEDGAVKGVRLAEVGLAHDGAPKGNHLRPGGDPRPDHDPRGRHPRRHLAGVHGALRRRREPAGLLAGHEGHRPVPRGQPVRQQPRDAHPGLPDAAQRLRRRLHVLDGREDRGGRADPGPRLEVRRPQPAARVRDVPRPPVHQPAAQGRHDGGDRCQDDPGGRSLRAGRARRPPARW